MSEDLFDRKLRVLYVPGGLVVSRDQPGQDTEARCGEASALWSTGEWDFVVVGGGLFLCPDIQSQPVAKIMEQWLIKRGVPEEKIWMESQSLDTFENVANLRQVLYDMAPYGEVVELCLVTHPTHVRRFAYTLPVYFPRLRITFAPVGYRLSFIARQAEKFFALVHRLWPRDGGPVGMLNRWLRRRAVAGIKSWQFWKKLPKS